MILKRGTLGALSLFEIFEDNRLLREDIHNKVSIEVMKIHLQNDSVQLNSYFDATVYYGRIRRCT